MLDNTYKEKIRLGKKETKKACVCIQNNVSLTHIHVFARDLKKIRKKDVSEDREKWTRKEKAKSMPME